ncbi:glycosyltransferase N-terminal domain-containing protein [Winogradskyella sp. SYSU M77433]|uniref:3-deoxy-D-manno-octulosonic acid transferase n=1 Tax=Winogradskyella sp. SYSU M77433 TaxID=3042722 RepID=UPI002480E166|nr:glycosyltransferase N-terminal domain-containing protein [Winogradskyella sp. SYSU M77433]MDH7911649.1 glycosyltransferase N-terminal domain-containing protein [Winogradskyella sp. SYSU M77433]
MKTLYSIAIYIASFIVKLLALFNPKLKQGVLGRKETFKKLETAISKNDKTFWFHCASLGEYEQGLPVFEALKVKHSDYKVVLSFFSPSGYEVRKNTKIADVVVYLPLDTKANAKRFLDLVHPNYIIFVKYEIWPNLLHEIKLRNLNAILISAVFRESQSFFKWYGSYTKSALFAFKHIFTQNESSKKHLENINYTNVSVSGDTRFDRVSNQLKVDNSVGFIEDFKGNNLCIVFGSTWPDDDKLYIDYINHLKFQNLKIIIAPHNIKPSYISSLKSQIKTKSTCFSEMEKHNLSESNVFILDTIGYLSRAYSYADIAYVGGAAGTTGLHNVLEPAVFGIPIIIGKNYDKFPEAKSLIELGGISSVASSEDFKIVMDKLIQNPEKRETQGDINSNFILNNKGAVIQILDFIRI